MIAADKHRMAPKDNLSLLAMLLTIVPSKRPGTVTHVDAVYHTPSGAYERPRDMNTPPHYVLRAPKAQLEGWLYIVRSSWRNKTPCLPLPPRPPPHFPTRPCNRPYTVELLSTKSRVREGQRVHAKDDILFSATRSFAARAAAV